MTKKADRPRVVELIGDPSAEYCVTTAVEPKDPYGEGKILHRGTKHECEQYLRNIAEILNVRTFASAAPSPNYDEHVVRLGLTRLDVLLICRLSGVASANTLEYVSQHLPVGFRHQMTVHEGGHQRADTFKLKPTFTTGDGEDVRPEFVYLHVGPQAFWVTYRSKNHDGPKWESDHIHICDVHAAWKPITTGCDVEEIDYSDMFTWPDGVHSEEELERAVEA
jgi:hypothetical protein